MARSLLATAVLAVVLTITAGQILQGGGSSQPRPQTYPGSPPLSTGGFRPQVQPVPSQGQHLGVQPGVENQYDLDSKTRPAVYQAPLSGAAPEERFLYKPRPPQWGGSGSQGGNNGWGSGFTSEQKPGKCPSTAPVPPYRLNCHLDECEQDEDCHGLRKCCVYACARICVDADFEMAISSQYEARHKIGSGIVAFDDEIETSLQLLPTDPGVYYPIDQFMGGGGKPNKPGNCPPNSNFGHGSGGYGGGWNNNGGSLRCTQDYSCPNNQKCCGGYCRTPAYIIG